MFEGAKARAAGAVAKVQEALRPLVTKTTTEKFFAADLGDETYADNILFPELVDGTESSVVARGSAIVSRNRFTGQVYGYEANGRIPASGELFTRTVGKVNSPNRVK